MKKINQEVKPGFHKEDGHESSNFAWRMLSRAMVAVPAVKYFLGVVGVAAAASLIGTLVLFHWQVAFVGGIVVFFGGVLIVVFANLARFKSGFFYPPAVVLIWAATALVCASAVCLFTGAFWGIPLDLRPYLRVENHAPAFGGTITNSTQVAFSGSQHASATVQLGRDGHISGELRLENDQLAIPFAGAGGFDAQVEVVLYDDESNAIERVELTSEHIDGKPPGKAIVRKFPLSSEVPDKSILSKVSRLEAKISGG